MVNKLYDRAAMNVTTIGTGTTLSLGSALGAVAPNVCNFLDFPTAGAQNGDPLRVLLLDNNGNMEVSTFSFSTSGPSLTGRTVELSSNSGSPISLTGNAQAFIIAGAGDIVTNFNGRSGPGITPTAGDYTYAANLIALPQSYLAGLQLSNDGTSPNTVIDITAGQCRDSTNAQNIILPAFTKSVSGSWAAGSGNNGMGNGLSVAANAWYHVFAINNAGSSDVYFDTSVTAANAPAGTTYSRRIGSIKTDGSSHILAFSQNGDEFLWNIVAQDISATNPGTTAVVRTLSVPPGVKVNAILHVQTDSNGISDGRCSISSLDKSDESAFNCGLYDGSGTYQFLNPELMNIRTNTSSQIRSRNAASGSNSVLYIYTAGWIDSRGRNV